MTTSKVRGTPVAITAYYSAGYSKAILDVVHLHPEDDHVPMAEVDEQASPAGEVDARELDRPTTFMRTTFECRRPDCDVRVVARVLHQVDLPKAIGVVIEHPDGRIQIFGDVPDDWATRHQTVSVQPMSREG